MHSASNDFRHGRVLLYIKMSKLAILLFLAAGLSAQYMPMPSTGTRQPRQRNTAPNKRSNTPSELLFKFDGVVKEANRLSWGLAAYAYTRNTKTAAAIGAAFESGMVSINHHGLALPEVPFGGVKDSGYGSEGGLEALEAYLNTKFVSQLGM